MFRSRAILLATGVILMTAPDAGAASAAPALRVTPNPVTQGQTTTAFLDGFCAASACSPVTVLVDGREVGAGRVDAHGKVTLRFVANQLPGQYPVVARQSTPDGQRSASTGLVILISDQPNGSPPPASTTPTQKPSPPASAKPTKNPEKTAQPTKSPTGSPTSDPSPPPASDNLTTAADEADQDGDDNNPIVLWATLCALAVAGTVLAWRRKRRKSGTS